MSTTIYETTKGYLVNHNLWEEFLNISNKDNFLTNNGLNPLDWESIQDCEEAEVIRYYALKKFNNNLNKAQDYIIENVKTDQNGNFLYSKAEKALLNLKGLENTAGFNYAAYLKECNIKPEWKEEHFQSIEEIDLALLGRSSLDEYEKDMVLETDWEALTRNGPRVPIIIYCQDKKLVDRIKMCRSNKYKYCLFSLLDNIPNYLFLIYGPNKLYEGDLADNQFRKLKKLRDQIQYTHNITVCDLQTDESFEFSETHESIINSLGEHSSFLPVDTKEYVKNKEKALTPSNYFDETELNNLFKSNPNLEKEFNHLWKLISEISFRSHKSTSYMSGKIDDAVHFRWFLIQYIFKYGAAPASNSKSLIKISFNLSNSKTLSQYTTVGPLVQACTNLDLSNEDHKSILTTCFDYCPGEKWKAIMSQVPGSSQLIYLTFILAIVQDLPLASLAPTTVLLFKMLMFCKHYGIPIDTISFHPWNEDIGHFNNYIQHFNNLIKFLISRGILGNIKDNASTISDMFPTNRLDNFSSLVKAMNSDREIDAFSTNNEIFRPGKCLFKINDILLLFKNIIYNKNNFNVKHYKTQVENLSKKEKDLIAGATGLNRECFEHEHNLTKKDVDLSLTAIEVQNSKHDKITPIIEIKEEDKINLVKYLLLDFEPNYEMIAKSFNADYSKIPGLDNKKDRINLFEGEEFDDTEYTIIDTEGTAFEWNIANIESIELSYVYPWENPEDISGDEEEKEDEKDDEEDDGEGIRIFEDDLTEDKTDDDDDDLSLLGN